MRLLKLKREYRNYKDSRKQTVPDLSYNQFLHTVGRHARNMDGQPPVYASPAINRS